MTGGPPDADRDGPGGMPDSTGNGVYDATTPTRYGVHDGIAGHPDGWRGGGIGARSGLLGAPRHVVGDGAVAALAVVAVAAVWSAARVPAADAASSTPVVAIVLAALVVAVRVGSWRWLLIVVLVVGAGAVRSTQAWASLEPNELGPFDGWVLVIDDPQPYASSTRIIVEVGGERFETWARGRAQQLRVQGWRGGERVRVVGDRVALDAQRAQRVAWQHVVGEFVLDWASDVDPGAPIARASNRVRAAIERAAEVLPEPDGALFRGLVIGDDRDQPRAMIDRFRASGLSHLTAVSGQNVAFVLAACGPLLVRMRPWPRWALTLAVIAWFVALTRFEPSILRAGVMAGLSATAFVRGQERSPVRLLALAVIGLVLVDPLLVWSIGFWLSVGATAGVCTVGLWLTARLAAFGFLALPLGVTIGAQVGVAMPSVVVFGRLPLVSVVANLLAVPVAGFVMLYGLPAGLLAGWVPVLAPVLMFPARVGTRWVDTVAVLGARLEPEPPWVWIGWGLVAIGVVVVIVVGRGKNRRPDGDASAER